MLLLALPNKNELKTQAWAVRNFANLSWIQWSVLGEVKNSKRDISRASKHIVSALLKWNS